MEEQVGGTPCNDPRVVFYAPTTASCSPVLDCVEHKKSVSCPAPPLVSEVEVMAAAPASALAAAAAAAVGGRFSAVGLAQRARQGRLMMETLSTASTAQENSSVGVKYSR